MRAAEGCARGGAGSRGRERGVAKSRTMADQMRGGREEGKRGRGEEDQMARESEKRREGGRERVQRSLWVGEEQRVCWDCVRGKRTRSIRGGGHAKMKTSAVEGQRERRRTKRWAEQGKGKERKKGVERREAQEGQGEAEVYGERDGFDPELGVCAWEQGTCACTQRR
eukprot:1761971-Rhodomonas_salina.1